MKRVGDYYQITLSSNKLTVQEITEFVSKITEAFLTKRNLESADKQFILSLIL